MGNLSTHSLKYGGKSPLVIHMEYKYKEIIVGSLQLGSRKDNIISDVKHIPDFIKKCNLEEEELYISYFNYSEDILSYYEEHKSVAKYPGKVGIDKIYMDFDISLEDFKRIIPRLPKDLYQIYFSGTGYHIHMENVYGFQPSENLHYIVKETLINDFPEGDSIYDKTRIFRCANTINKKSNLYKTELKIENLTTKEEVESKCERFNIHYSLPTSPLIVTPIWKDKAKTAPLVFSSPQPINATITEDYTKIATCIHKIYNEGPVKGTRHSRMLRIASVFRRAGIPGDAIIKMLTSWSGLSTSEVSTIVMSVFKTPLEYGCYDPVLHSFCSIDCVYYKNKNLITTKSMKELEGEYIKFLFSSNASIINLKDYYPIPTNYKIYPGEFVLIIGDTGIGKTAFIQNICVKNVMPTLYLSLEVGGHLLFRRFLQIKHGLTKDSLYEYYTENGPGKIVEGLEHIQCQFANPKLDSLEKLITSSNAKVVVIDTLDGIIIPYAKDSVMSNEKIANTMKELAQKHNLIIFGVHHISKSASYSGKLTIHSGKGSSSLEQKADKLLSIEGDKETSPRTVSSLKARDEESFRLLLNYNFKTFSYDNI